MSLHTFNIGDSIIHTGDSGAIAIETAMREYIQSVSPAIYSPSLIQELIDYTSKKKKKKKISKLEFLKNLI